MINRQFSRYTQLQSLTSYSLVSRSLSSNLILSKFNSNNKMSIYSVISKSILFNLTLFQKNKYYSYKSLFFNEKVAILLFDGLNNTILSEGLILVTNYVFKMLRYDNNQSKYFFILLINILVRKILAILTSFRKILVLNILLQKLLS